MTDFTVKEGDIYQKLKLKVKIVGFGVADRFGRTADDTIFGEAKMEPCIIVENLNTVADMVKGEHWNIFDENKFVTGWTKLTKQ